MKFSGTNIDFSPNYFNNLRAWELFFGRILKSDRYRNFYNFYPDDNNLSYYSFHFTDKNFRAIQIGKRTHICFRLGKKGDAPGPGAAFRNSAV